MRTSIEGERGAAPEARSGADEPPGRQGGDAAAPEATAAGPALLKGAAILGLAAVVSKLIGTLQKIPFQNMAGEAAFGVYNAVYPLYMLILFMATAGFPLVVAKFVAEYAAEGRDDKAQHVLRASVMLLAATGTGAFLLLYLGADRIASWIGAAQTAPAIRSISFALLIVPGLSGLRGYYQGYHNMAPTAWSQVIEQTVRVAVMFLLLVLLLRWGYGYEYIAAGATFGSVVGAAAGLGYMLWYGRSRAGRGRAGTGTCRRWPRTGWREDARMIRRLAVYALPVCLGSIAMPVLTLVDSFTIPRLLLSRGYDDHGAMYQFGLYNHGLPLVQLVTMIVSAVSAALVPAMAEALRREDRAAIRLRAAASIKWVALIGLAASIGLAVLARPMNVMFYNTAEGTSAMVILAFTAFFSAVNIAGSSVLQGLGAVFAPALYLLLAAGLKAGANAALVPRLGIDGAAWAAVAAYACAGGLALAHALRRSGAGPAAGGRAASVMKPLLAAGFMTLALLAAMRGIPAAALALLPALPARACAAAVALGGVAVGACAYAAALGALGVVSAAELERLGPRAARPLALLRRLRLLR